jgi:predicted enzyme related to lactoylglutathione lyase
MVLKKATNFGGVEFIKWAEQEEGFEVKGFLTKKKPSANYPDVMQYYIEKEDGGKVCLNGSANLDAAMEVVPMGCYLEIVYQGKVSLKGGNSCHQFDVSYDDGRVIEKGEIPF